MKNNTLFENLYFEEILDEADKFVCTMKSDEEEYGKQMEAMLELSWSVRNTLKRLGMKEIHSSSNDPGSDTARFSFVTPFTNIEEDLEAVVEHVIPDVGRVTKLTVAVESSTPDDMDTYTVELVSPEMYADWKNMNATALIEDRKRLKEFLLEFIRENDLAFARSRRMYCESIKEADCEEKTA